MKYNLIQRANAVIRVRSYMSGALDIMWTGIAKRSTKIVEDAFETYQIARLVGIEDLEMKEDDFETYDKGVKNLPWSTQVPMPQII